MSKSLMALAAVAMLLGALSATAGPLHDAVRDGDLSRLQELIAAGEDLTAQDNIAGTALHWAALTDNVDAARLLIDAGIDLNLAKRSNQQTALHVAAERGNIEVATLLVAAGADLKAGTTTGYTPLHIAAGSDNLKVGKLLIEAGADIEARVLGGATPLMAAAVTGAVGAIALLVAEGADVDAKRLPGETPLYLAATYGQADAVGKLLELGADVNGAPDVEPVFRSTPLAGAITQSLGEIADILCAAGATE